MSGNYTGKKNWALKAILISGSKGFKYHDATTFECYQAFILNLKRVSQSVTTVDFKSTPLEPLDL